MRPADAFKQTLTTGAGNHPSVSRGDRSGVFGCRTAGPGSGLSEELVWGCEPAALESESLPCCPPRHVLVARVLRTASLSMVQKTTATSCPIPEQPSVAPDPVRALADMAPHRGVPGLVSAVAVAAEDGLVGRRHLDRHRPLVGIHPDHHTTALVFRQLLRCSLHDWLFEPGGQRCFELGNPLLSLSWPWRRPGHAGQMRATRPAWAAEVRATTRAPGPSLARPDPAVNETSSRGAPLTGLQRASGVHVSEMLPSNCPSRGHKSDTCATCEHGPRTSGHAASRQRSQLTDPHRVAPRAR